MVLTIKFTFGKLKKKGGEKVYQVSLKAARVNAGYTQKEVAEKMNVSKATIISWESGSSAPKSYQFKALSEFYKAPLNSIKIT